MMTKLPTLLQIWSKRVWFSSVCSSPLKTGVFNQIWVIHRPPENLNLEPYNRKESPSPSANRHSLGPTDLGGGQERSKTWVSQDVMPWQSYLENGNNTPCFTEFVKVKFLLPPEQCQTYIHRVLDNYSVECTLLLNSPLHYFFTEEGPRPVGTRWEPEGRLQSWKGKTLTLQSGPPVLEPV